MNQGDRFTDNFLSALYMAAFCIQGFACQNTFIHAVIWRTIITTQMTPHMCFNIRSCFLRYGYICLPNVYHIIHQIVQHKNVVAALQNWVYVKDHVTIHANVSAYELFQQCSHELNDIIFAYFMAFWDLQLYDKL